ncbi:MULTISPECIES: hypothetical protein [unclassified Blastococcus]
MFSVAFLAEPLRVEVHHRDGWHRGVLLGWRHDADDACWLRVSAVVDGLKQSAWVPLAAVRLPGTAPAASAPPRLVRHGDRDAPARTPALPRPRPSLPADRVGRPLPPVPA